MKKAVLIVCLFPMMLLSACQGFDKFFICQTCSGGGGGTSTTSGYFYVLYKGSSEVVGYYVNSGTLTAVTANSASLSYFVDGTSIAVSPNNKFLYVGTTDGIFAYSISSTGALTALNSISGAISPISSDAAVSLQVDSTNSWIVAAVNGTSGNGTLQAIPVSTTTGVPVSGATEQSIALSGASVNQLVISPDNKHVFVAEGTSGTDEFAFSATGSAQFTGPTNHAVLVSGGGAISVAVDSTSADLFVGESSAYTGSTTNTGGVRIFTISSTANTLTDVTGTSPYTTSGNGPTSILVDANNLYLYVANRTVSGQTASEVMGYSLTLTTPKLTALSNSIYSDGTTPLQLVEDNQKSFVISVNSGGSPMLEIYTFSTTVSGALTSSITDSTYSQPVAVAAQH